jgi:hypothetical protein
MIETVTLSTPDVAERSHHLRTDQESLGRGTDHAFHAVALAALLHQFQEALTLQFGKEVVQLLAGHAQRSRQRCAGCGLLQRFQQAEPSRGHQCGSLFRTLNHLESIFLYSVICPTFC